jgi:hypothetical protein
MTMYLPTDEEALEGIGPWNDATEPANLASFETDRYARQLRAAGSAPYALLNGSIGSTNVAGGK